MSWIGQTILFLNRIVITIQEESLVWVSITLKQLLNLTPVQAIL